jgi:hypothetical protein
MEATRQAPKNPDWTQMEGGRVVPKKIEFEFQTPRIRGIQVRKV